MKKKGIGYYVRTLLAYVKNYKFPAILTPVCMIGEVIFEVLIPLQMAKMVDVGIPLAAENGNYSYILTCGGLMAAMAAFTAGIAPLIFSPIIIIKIVLSEEFAGS